MSNPIDTGALDYLVKKGLDEEEEHHWGGHDPLSDLTKPVETPAKDPFEGLGPPPNDDDSA
jgi:hypothetical protein